VIFNFEVRVLPLVTGLMHLQKFCFENPLCNMKKIIWVVLLFDVACSPSLLPDANHTFIVIAHRGDHTGAPENTLKAFEQAITDGADYVEVDVRTSHDGTLIVMHDATVDRMTNGTGRIHEMNFSELQRLQVVDKVHPEYGSFSIPTLQDVLALCKNKMNIYLDFKDADVTATWQLLQKTKAEKSVVIYINSKEQYSAWRQVAPHVPLMISLPDSVTNAQSLSHFLDIVDAEILDGNFSQYTEEMVQVAESRGRVVWADIQQPGEGPELWEKALQTKLHGLQTDSPMKLIRYLQEKNQR
jgi:glycerophosphoryl diester phosphodiesterase